VSAPWWNQAQRKREADERARARDEQVQAEQDRLRALLREPDQAALTITGLSPFAPVSAYEVTKALAAEVVRLQERVAQLEAR